MFKFLFRKNAEVILLFGLFSAQMASAIEAGAVNNFRQLLCQSVHSQSWTHKEFDSMSPQYRFDPNVIWETYLRENSRTFSDALISIGQGKDSESFRGARIKLFGSTIGNVEGTIIQGSANKLYLSTPFGRREIWLDTIERLSIGIPRRSMDWDVKSAIEGTHPQGPVNLTAYDPFSGRSKQFENAKLKQVKWKEGYVEVEVRGANGEAHDLTIPMQEITSWKTLLNQAAENTRQGSPAGGGHEAPESYAVLSTMLNEANFPLNSEITLSVQSASGDLASKHLVLSARRADGTLELKDPKNQWGFYQLKTIRDAGKTQFRLFSVERGKPVGAGDLVIKTSQ